MNAQFSEGKLIAALNRVLATLLLFASAQSAITEDLAATAGQRTEPRATIVNAAALPKGNPPGMAWIPGGKFSMGAAISGHGSCEMAMQSNDSEPIHRRHPQGPASDIRGRDNYPAGVDQDDATPVSTDYKESDNSFTGKILKVTVDVKPIGAGVKAEADAVVHEADVRMAVSN